MLVLCWCSKPWYEYCCTEIKVERSNMDIGHTNVSSSIRWGCEVAIKHTVTTLHHSSLGSLEFIPLPRAWVKWQGLRMGYLMWGDSWYDVWCKATWPACLHLAHTCELLTPHPGGPLLGSHFLAMMKES